MIKVPDLYQLRSRLGRAEFDLGGCYHMFGVRMARSYAQKRWFFRVKQAGQKFQVSQYPVVLKIYSLPRLFMQKLEQIKIEYKL